MEIVVTVVFTGWWTDEVCYYLW